MRRATIGIEIPNKHPHELNIKTVLSSNVFQESCFQLPIAFGVNANNDVSMADLTKMPHLLIAGASGQGITVALNAIIASLL